MSKNIARLTAALSGVVLFVFFQNFSTYQMSFLNSHISRKIFLTTDVDFIAKTPSSAVACEMNIDSNYSDYKITLQENKSLSSIVYLNPNAASTKRTITLSPAGCFYQGAIEVADDNIELDCNGAYIDGSLIPAKYYPTGSTNLTKSSRSGILVGKSFRQKVSNGISINIPILISS